MEYASRFLSISLILFATGCCCQGERKSNGDSSDHSAGSTSADVAKKKRSKKERKPKKEVDLEWEGQVMFYPAKVGSPNRLILKITNKSQGPIGDLDIRLGGDAEEFVWEKAIEPGKVIAPEKGLLGTVTFSTTTQFEKEKTVSVSIAFTPKTAGNHKVRVTLDLKGDAMLKDRDARVLDLAVNP